MDIRETEAVLSHNCISRNRGHSLLRNHVSCARTADRERKKYIRICMDIEGKRRISLLDMKIVKMCNWNMIAYYILKHNMYKSDYSI